MHYFEKFFFKCSRRNDLHFTIEHTPLAYLAHTILISKNIAFPSNYKPHLKSGIYMKNSVRKKSNKNPKTRVFHPARSTAISSIVHLTPIQSWKNFIPLFFILPFEEAGNAIIQLANPFLFLPLFPSQPVFVVVSRDFITIPFTSQLRKVCSSLVSTIAGLFVCSPALYFP